jgi:hypothetical protein
MAQTRWLKWRDDVIGVINSDWDLKWTKPAYNQVVADYAKGAEEWISPKFHRFLERRIVSRGRRDIEKILFRLGLSSYDVFRIAEITGAINPRDLIWIAPEKNARFDDAVTAVFDSVFNKKVDLQGDSLDSPEGQNIKRYGVRDGRYGIYKKRLNPLSTDAESEIAAYLLAQKMGIPCCPAYYVDKDTVFSEFRYDFSEEYIVHFRNLFGNIRTENEYYNLVTLRPQYTDDINRMMLFDFVTRQDDRHLSNIAVKISGKGGETFYPLYDNGRGLFYEDTEETVEKAVKDIPKYGTVFGMVGSYWEHIRDIAKNGADFSRLANLDITKDEIAAILKEARFTGYRLDGGIEWISGALALAGAVSAASLTPTLSPAPG